MPGTVHPKVSAAAVASLVFTVAVVAADYFGVNVDPGVQAALSALVAVAAGYLKSAPDSPKAG